MHTIEFEGVTYKFAAISIEGEEEWAQWVREQAMTEGKEFSEGWPLDLRAAFLAKVSSEASLAKCGFTTEFGLENFLTIAGVAKALELAARKHHPAPHPPYEIMLRLVKAKEREATQAALSVIPVSEEFRTLALGELEKKASGQKAGLLSRPSKSAAPSAESPGASPPIRLAE